MMTNNQVPVEMQPCMQALTACQQACMETMAHCLQMDSQHKNMSLICILRDCAEMSTMCLNLLIDGSEFAGRTCLLCADMAEQCARACEELKTDAKTMECAAICHQCAAACKGVGQLASTYFRREILITEQELVSAQ